MVASNPESLKDTAKILDDDDTICEPKIILSITGGARNFTIDEATKSAFKRGLLKAAKSTNSWIITGGSDVGVMKLVGDMINEDLSAKDLTVIGVSSDKRLKETFFRNIVTIKVKVHESELMIEIN